jgi:hypothetical protein
MVVVKLCNLLVAMSWLSLISCMGYVCVYMCVSVCMCVCIYIYIYIYIHTHTYVQAEIKRYKDEVESLKRQLAQAPKSGGGGGGGGADQVC